jgi:microcystin-dependent protein
MGTPYVGEIRMFGGNFAPAGWMFCAGQLLPIAEYDTLFNLIGTTYGGDGQTTFALPNLQSRVPLHIGSGFVIGQMGGQESVTLTAQQLPAHTHSPVGDGGGVNTSSPSNNVWGNWGTTGSPYSTQAPSAQMNPQTLLAAGGSQPHDNMLPYLAVNYIISLFGIYPPQS